MENPRRQGQRQLRLHRHAERGEEGPGRAGHRHAGDHRQGREDPGRVQSGRSRWAYAPDRLREPRARRTRTSTTTREGRGRDRMVNGDGAVRERAGGRGAGGGERQGKERGGGRRKGELGRVKLKAPSGDTSQLLEVVVRDADARESTRLPRFEAGGQRRRETRRTRELDLRRASASTGASRRTSA